AAGEPAGVPPAGENERPAPPVSAPPAAAPPTVPAAPANVPPAVTAVPPPAPSAAPRPAAPLEEAAGDFALGPPHRGKIPLPGHDDLTQTIVVQSDGTFIFPLIGRVKAADLTPKELERKITTLLAQGYLRNPQVSVSVQEYRSKTVFVVGEVSRPGSFSLSGRMTVLELLSKAGPTSAAGVEVVIVRPKGGAVTGPMVPVDPNGNPNADVASQADL